MTKNHIKRINAPKRWNILRKEHKFISRPNPGRSLDMSISLNTCLKEMLGKTKTTKESKYLIKHRGVLVNAVKRHDEKFPVGFLDVVTIPETDEHFRLIVSAQNRLEMVKIPAAESKIKLSKVSNKTVLPGGKLQLNCTDGRNFIIDKKDAKGVGINDTVSYSIPEQKVHEIFKLEKGSLVFLYKGKHIGRLVPVEGFKAGNILFKEEGEVLETKKEYAFTVGKDKPLITVTAHGHAHAENAETHEKKAPAKKAHKKESSN